MDQPEPACALCRGICSWACLAERPPREPEPEVIVVEDGVRRGPGFRDDGVTYPLDGSGWHQAVAVLEPEPDR
jgi:hypothetical protein